MRLIDADAYEFPGDLINEPTINPDDLRARGRWIDIDRLGVKPEWVCRCSLCGCPQDFKHHYCPHCGAMMDGKKNEDVCTTCRFYPPSSCDGKPCTACGHGNPCYQRKENEDA